MNTGKEISSFHSNIKYNVVGHHQWIACIRSSCKWPTYIDNKCNGALLVLSNSDPWSHNQNTL